MLALAEVASAKLAGGERDNRWLRQELNYLWITFFSDVPHANSVMIEYSRGWKNRLGMICLSLTGRTSYIGINSLLRLPQVPSYVALVTIAHELVHYSHGFGSPLPRRYEHPHRGGVVVKELVNRGLGSEYDLYLQWIREHWEVFYARNRSSKQKRRTALASLA